MAAVPNSIITPQRIVAGTAVCTTANTNYSAPTAAVQLIATQTDGARITRLTVSSNATNTATDCQLYSSPDGGTTKRFIGAKLLTAYTLSQTSPQTPLDFGFGDSGPLLLAPGESLYAAIGVAQTGVVFRAEGGGY